MAIVRLRRLQEISLKSLLAQASTLYRACLMIIFTVSLLVVATYVATQKSENFRDTKPLTGGSLHLVSKSFWGNLTSEPRDDKCLDTRCPLVQREAPREFQSKSTPSCPSFFQWIYEDLDPWMEKGISKKLIATMNSSASFRVVIVKGRLFIEPFRPCFQTRALFTIWGLAQLLNYYPGAVPDVDLMFSCDDRPVVQKKNFKNKIPPPIFRYCSTWASFDVPFPDWSFWGWSEINLRPWDEEASDIVKGSQETKWADRRPTAYWKGNPYVAKLREELLNCNSSEWGAEIFIQNWIAEGASGYPQSKLSDQCKHRYKIYAEGWGWSASLKYILACDSPTLVITPQFHDFFIRGLIPQVSYWPVRYKKMCESIKFAVDWGNTHHDKAQAIGKAAQEYITKQVSMKHVYDYMLHLLKEYAKLLKFKPSVPPNAEEVCTHSIFCQANPAEKPFLQRSTVKTPSASPPCSLAARDRAFIDSLAKSQRRGVRAAEWWEDKAWAKDKKLQQ